MTKDNMMLKVVKTYGLESKEAIEFCKLAENEHKNYEEIVDAYNKLKRDDENL